MTLPLDEILKAAEGAQEASDAFDQIGDDQTVADLSVARINRLAARDELDRLTPYSTIRQLALVARAAEAFLAKVEALEPEINSRILLASVHGVTWPNDRNWGVERDVLRQALGGKS